MHATHLPPAATFAGLAVFALFLAVLGCSGAPDPAPADDPAYVEEVSTWRAERETRLTSDTGWLTVAGLWWLEPGDNVVGSDPQSDVVLPEGSCPANAGVLRYHPEAEGSKVELIPADDAGFTIDGRPAGAGWLRGDDEEQRDVVEAGRVTFWIIHRGDRYGVRVRDPQSSLRTEFTGIEAYPVASAYRVEGRLQRYDSLREIDIPNVVGYQSRGLTPGPVVFELEGRELSLYPTVSDAADSTLFFVFADETSGGETYGGGRFLYAEVGPSDRVVLDFNKAYNPPCAFNPYTTCPLPIEENVLPVAVRAGEKAHAAHP